MRSSVICVFALTSLFACAGDNCMLGCAAPDATSAETASEPPDGSQIPRALTAGDRAQESLERMFQPGDPPRKATPKELTLFFTTKALAMFKSYERVEAFRVHSNNPWDKRPRPPKGTPELGGYPVLSKPARVSKQTVDSLVANILNRSAGDFGSNKLCGGFQPGVGLRFYGADPDSSVAILFCFHCSDLMVVHEHKLKPVPTAKDFAVYSADDDLARQMDMSGSERELLKLLRVSFPDDVDLRELEARVGH